MRKYKSLSLTQKGALRYPFEKADANISFSEKLLEIR